jgi:hypothetical protein
MSDPVNKPAHYNAGEVETIDGIRAALGEGFADYCRGNVLKYVWRCGKKGDAVEDLRKARKYLEWAIEAMEGNCPVIPDSSSRKPIAIPAGWRELEPDEVPKSTDMHEWMGGWYYRNDDATNEYKWHSSRHVRKIETSEPGPIAIPAGWRELKPDEFPKVTDMYENEGGHWRSRIDDSSFLYARYEVRHIRKIETANTSEAPNNSIPDPGEGYRLLSKEPSEPVRKGDEFWQKLKGEWVEIAEFVHETRQQAPSYYYRRKIETKPTEWIPKVGDKVRVIGLGVIGEIKYTDGIGDHCWLVLCQDGSYRWRSIKRMELIEAAS